MKKLVKDSKWFEDINYQLKYHNKTTEDILYIVNNDKWCTWQEFINLRVFKQYLFDIDWIIVGSDFFIDFTECEGVCFWDFKKIPQKPLKRLNIKDKKYN